MHVLISDLVKMVGRRKSMVIGLLGAAMALAAPDAVHAQTQTSNMPLVFGIAATKICEIKTFLFTAVYVLAAIAFVFFAIKSIFTKFEARPFISIIATVFLVAVADYVILFVAPNAYFCPPVF